MPLERNLLLFKGEFHSQLSDQEYLDREYDYRLDFILKGDQWLYCDVVINVLDWSKRIQNENL